MPNVAREVFWHDGIVRPVQRGELSMGGPDAE